MVEGNFIDVSIVKGTKKESLEILKVMSGFRNKIKPYHLITQSLNYQLIKLPDLR